MKKDKLADSRSTVSEFFSSFLSRPLLTAAAACALAASSAACGSDPKDSPPPPDDFNPTPGGQTSGGGYGYGYGSGGGGGGGGGEVDPPVPHKCYRDADCEGDWMVCDLQASPHECVLADGRCLGDTDCDVNAGEKCSTARHECFVDACEDVTCSNGGVCSTEGNAPYCNCPHGYTGSGTNCTAFSEIPDWFGVQWADPWQGSDRDNNVPLKFEKDQTTGTTIYGQVYWNGKTNTTNSLPSGWRMQLGLTTASSVAYPVIASDFDWHEMNFNSTCTACDNNLEWNIAFPTDTEGTFRWILRFTSNNGQDWVYGDVAPGFIQSAQNKPGTAVIGSGGGGETVTTGCDHGFLSLTMTHPTNGSSQTGGYEFTITYTGQNPDPVSALTQAAVTRQGVTVDVVAAVTGNSGIPTLNVSYDGNAKSVTISEAGLTNGKYDWLFKDGEGCSLYVPIWIEDTRFQWEDGFMYQVMTDRFVDGDTSNNAPVGTETDLNDWMGGDWKGLTAKMKEGYFDNMGANVLWISTPVLNTNGYGKGKNENNGNMEKFAAYHAYWPIATGWTDVSKQSFIDAGITSPIEPHFGSEADLRELIAEAHKRGIRVVVDFVANHVFGTSNPADSFGTQSPLWENYADKGWFNIDPQKFCGDYTDGTMNYDHPYWTFRCWFNSYLADFDFDGSDAALNTVLDHAMWLAQEYGFDGFRLDAVKHMSMKFTTGIRSRIKSTMELSGLPFYTVGETFDGNENNLVNWIGDDKLTGQFSFAFYYKVKPILENNASYGDIGNGITYLDTFFRNKYNKAIMPNFMGNHDVVRALRFANGDHGRLRRAQTVVMTSPEMPLIYQGDDIGMDGGADPDNRRMMLFGNSLSNDQKATLSHLQKLGTARKNHKAFRYGKRTNCLTEPDAWVYKMERDGDVAIVGINRGNGAVSGTCQGVSGSLTDVLNGGTSNNGSFSIPAGGSAVYVRQ